MNIKQSLAWKQLVRQCKTQCEKPHYNSINVASTIRSEAIVAASALVELVTPELAKLLEQLASSIEVLAGKYTMAERTLANLKSAYALAASIREVLEANDESA